MTKRSKLSTQKTGWLLSSLVISMLLSGCASIGKGAAEAVLEKSEREDTRQCQVWGEPFAGIKADLDKNKGRTKVLFVHGVGDRYPGYTTEFLEKLAKELNLDARSEGQKNIQLTTPLFPDKNLGNLRVTHLLNEKSGKELTFYELTWSEITRQEKALLNFDTSGEYDFRRARINAMLKKFSNDTGPDPIIYLGESRVPILAAFAQSFCWMATGEWEELPKSGKHACTGLNDTSAGHIANDDYVIISHSLGSRIAIDGMQRIATLWRLLKNAYLKTKKSPFPQKQSRHCKAIASQSSCCPTSCLCCNWAGNFPKWPDRKRVIARLKALILKSVWSAKLTLLPLVIPMTC